MTASNATFHPCQFCSDGSNQINHCGNPCPFSEFCTIDGHFLPDGEYRVIAGELFRLLDSAPASHSVKKSRGCDRCGSALDSNGTCPNSLGTYPDPSKENRR